jgi:pyrroloquinoline quinone (PQQ) biosynthesis protein C
MQNHPARLEIFAHNRFIQAAESAMPEKVRIDKQQAEFMLGQYWPMIKEFTRFLGLAVKLSPDIPTQTAISRILYQELGQGNSRNAHFSIYEQNIIDLGMDIENVRNAERLSSCKKLHAMYADGSVSRATALGYLYATETVDLALVSSIGFVLKTIFGEDKRYPWVDIHVKEEPDHVESADEIVSDRGLSLEEREECIYANGKMLILWDEMFSETAKMMFSSKQ